MGLQYSHLSELERAQVEHLRTNGLSYAAIGRSLGRSASTIMRECRRGHNAALERYLAYVGQHYYLSARRRAGVLRRKLGADLNSSMWQLVSRGLRVHWSPEQIAGRLRALDPLRGPLLASAQYVSHETIYRAIYDLPRRGGQRHELVSLLRQSRAGRRRRSRGRQRFVGLQGFTPIAERPTHIEQREEPGHWEGDIMEGARGTLPVVATVVERTSRLVRLVKLNDGTAHALLHGLTQRLGREAPGMLRSLTYDRGTEMARHKELEAALGIEVYICQPYSPWQRGANENTNGLIRQYLPKGMDLTHVSQAHLEKIEFILNNRPRRVLGFRTPQEVFDRLRRDPRWH